jgi:hypothetical protein
MRPRRLVTATVFMSLVVLLVLSGAACSIYGPLLNGWPPSPLDPPSGTVTTDRPFSSIDSGWLHSYPGHLLDAPTMYVLRSHDELVALRDLLLSYSHYDESDLPEIDFEKELVIALIDVDEPSSGYSIRIDRLEETPEGIIVRATKTAPPPWAGTLSIVTDPRHVITTARTDKPFVLSLRVGWVA